jgi:triosephosphate isomerase (TIM)
MTYEDGRRPIVGGNWKMNTNVPAAMALAESMVWHLGNQSAVEVVLFPPFPNLEAVHRVIDGSVLQLGAQDLFWEDAGAYTGEVSAPMLSAVGCVWALVGHSERRQLFGESSDIVNRKLQAALRHNLNVILAIGETGDERKGGHTETICSQQLHASLADVKAEDFGRIVIAYEPVWAIGTGETASPEQARDAHAHVRRVLAQLYGDGAAAATRIQYGGSVSASNAAELMAQPGIDGALVGGASLKPPDFAAIVEAAAQ